MLDLVLQLRDLRKDAITQEIERLKDEIAAQGGEVEEEEDYWEVQGESEGTAVDAGADDEYADSEEKHQEL
jgi:hypothetical protein